jgi:hypothetical protein
MNGSSARVETEQPERYIKQIVSHLSHKLRTRLDEGGVGVVELDDGGACVLTPQQGLLVLQASAPDATALAHACDVVGRHLERFGGREGLRVTWTSP